MIEQHVHHEGWRATMQPHILAEIGSPAAQTYTFRSPEGEETVLPRYLVELIVCEQYRQLLIERVKEAEPFQVLSGDPIRRIMW